MCVYWVYIIKSLSKKRYYIGCTCDLERRINEHNKGKTKSTKPYVPWRFIYAEGFSKKSEAFKREWFLKHPKGYLEKINIIKKLERSHSGRVRMFGRLRWRPAVLGGRT